MLTVFAFFDVPHIATQHKPLDLLQSIEDSFSGHSKLFPGNGNQVRFPRHPRTISASIVSGLAPCTFTSLSVGMASSCCQCQEGEAADEQLRIVCSERQSKHAWWWGSQMQLLA